MRALVIYDLTGRVWQIIYGEEKVPQGLPAVFVDIPEGAQLERMDVTDPENPKPVFNYLPETDIGRIQKKVADLEEELTDTQLALAEQYEENLALQEEVTNTQLALVELYEGGGGVTMAKVYADLIRKGLKTLEQVPEKLKAEVEAMLHA